jgi:hypothetical protein
VLVDLQSFSDSEQIRQIGKPLHRILAEIENFMDGRKVFVAHYCFLVIIGNFDIICVGGFPSETYPPLIVAANAMLSLTVAFQSFQSVSGWNTQNL